MPQRTAIGITSEINHKHPRSRTKRFRYQKSTSPSFLRGSALPSSLFSLHTTAPATAHTYIPQSMRPASQTRPF